MAPRKFFLTTLLLSSLVLVIATSRAIAADPASDLYLKGYMLFQEAEKAEKANDFGVASQKYGLAKGIFDEVATRHPEFYPRVLIYRRKVVNEALQRLGLSTPGPGAGVGLASPQRPARPIHSDMNARFPAQANGVIAQQNEQIEQLARQRDEALSKMREIELERDERSRELARERIARKELTERLQSAKSLGNASEVAEFEEQLRLSEQAYTRLNQIHERLRNDLLSKNIELAESKDKIVELQRERDELKSLLTSREAGEERRLLEENQALRDQLKQAQLEIARLESDGKAKDAEIAQLRGDLDRARETVAQLKKENADYQRRMAALSDRLRSTASQLDEALKKSRKGVAEEILAENKLLRQVIVREMKQVKRRHDEQELLVAQLNEKYGEIPGELLERIEALSNGGIRLTEDERSLFSDSMIAGLVSNEQVFVSDQAGETTLKNPELKVESQGDRQHLSNSAAYYFLQGDYEKSEETFEKLVESTPGNVEYLRNLGIVQVRMKKREIAEMNLQRALAFEPNDAQSNLALGWLFYLNQDLDRSLSAMEKAIEINPKSATAHFIRGAIFAREKDNDNARQAFEAAAESDPKLLEAHYNLAVLALDQSPPDRRAARIHYRQFLLNGGRPDPAMQHQVGG